MIMIPNPPKFFARSSLRHVLWQIETLDITLALTGRVLAQAITTEAKAEARQQINAQLDHRLTLMAQRDALQKKEGA